MTLREIIKIEADLLFLNMNFIETLNITECVVLRRYLSQIKEITDIYFEKINIFKVQENNKEEAEKKLYEYNDKLLNEKIEEDLIDSDKIIIFINLMKEKYYVVFPS